MNGGLPCGWTGVVVDMEDSSFINETVQDTDDSDEIVLAAVTELAYLRGYALQKRLLIRRQVPKVGGVGKVF